MQPTEILKQEHRVIEQVLDCLEVMASQSSGGAGLDTESAREAIEFFRSFADRCHHGKEEDCLFPLMESKGFSREQGPTGVMLTEHELGRSHVRGMAAAVEEVEAGDGSRIADFVSHAESFIQLLRAHIQKEDECLFQMADQALSAADQQYLLAAFDKVEHEDLGPGTHEKYLNVAKRLAERFSVSYEATNSAGDQHCCHHHE